MPDPLWGARFDEPLVVLTADQDWAPDWALRRTLDLVAAHDVPFHLFVTNPSPALDDRSSEVTLGIHPNILPGSTHGESHDDVVAHCADIVPEARTYRTHAFAESTHLVRLLAARGFVADSNVCCFLQPGLVPLVHAGGVLRLPVFLEDDVLLDWAGGVPDVTAIASALTSPGLKVLNFHPALVGANVASAEQYGAQRAEIYGSEPLPHTGDRGIATLLDEVLALVTSLGIRVAAFEEVVDDALAALSRSAGAPFGWPLRGAARR